MRCYLFLPAVAASFSLLSLSYASQDGLRHRQLDVEDKLVKVEDEIQDGEALSDWPVKTIPNLLSDAECDIIMSVHNFFNGKVDVDEAADMHEKAVVPVSIEMAQRIQTFAADHEEKLTPASHFTNFQLLIIHRTTYLHKDEDDAGMMTAMVFLEDNKDAYFWIEELGQKISIEKGKLVAFDARFTHNTVIRGTEEAKASSPVYLLGPTRVRLDAVADTSISVQLQRNLKAANLSDVNISFANHFNVSTLLLGNNGTSPTEFDLVMFEAEKNVEYIYQDRSFLITGCPVSCSCQPQTNVTCTASEKSTKSGKVRN